MRTRATAENIFILFLSDIAISTSSSKQPVCLLNERLPWRDRVDLSLFSFILLPPSSTFRIHSSQCIQMHAIAMTYRRSFYFYFLQQQQKTFIIRFWFFIYFSVVFARNQWSVDCTPESFIVDNHYKFLFIVILTVYNFQVCHLHYMIKKRHLWRKRNPKVTIMKKERISTTENDSDFILLCSNDLRFEHRRNL